MGRRRTLRADDTLRPLLLAYWRSRFGTGGRWHIAGRTPEFMQQLADGDAVLIDSSSILTALMHANLPHEDYEYGGQHWGKVFLLGADDVVTEWTAEDQAALDPEPDAHCKGGRTCIRCDPDNTGQQTIDVPRARQSWDWYFIEWPSDDDQLNKEAQHA